MDSYGGAYNTLGHTQDTNPDVLRHTNGQVAYYTSRALSLGNMTVSHKYRVVGKTRHGTVVDEWPFNAVDDGQGRQAACRWMRNRPTVWTTMVYRETGYGPYREVARTLVEVVRRKDL